ncbi:MAG: precorrin-3B C(17)-methyltransferase [Dehalococcoidales bacterium]|jgi:cobalt-precorrin 5A hydrolase/precorrin-3B C17-methyltransferase|nr:precorrin-3B C(17)-methyltransferase [Dehalococcoidales bacterium]
MDTVHPDKIAVIAITRKGVDVGRQLGQLFPGGHLYLPQKFVPEPQTNEHLFLPPVKTVVEEAFTRYRYLVLIMALGAAVRILASQVKDKRNDPGVVVVDERGTFAISLLSGHIGGANALTEMIASGIGARPVITTASDVGRIIAVDLIGREFGWELESDSHVTAVSAALVNGEPVGIYQDVGERSWQQKGSLPVSAHIYDNPEALKGFDYRAAIIITDHVLSEEHHFPGPAVVYRPKSLVLGIGCNRGTRSAVIDEAVQHVFYKHGLSAKSIRSIATIDVKRDEPGLREFASKYNLPVDFFDSNRLSQAAFPSSPSAVAMKYVGTPSVCEAAAILNGGIDILVPKETYQGAVTVAVGRLSFDDEIEKGKLFVVGIGPGDMEHMTQRAREAIHLSETVAGYKTYVNLIEPLLTGKEVIATGMGDEVQRVKTAVGLAGQGKTVSLVCSGDAGIYGMAGLVLEVLHEAGEIINLEIVPGVPSLAAAAALLGAPLMTDFAVISLSDYLVSWEDISRRLKLAAQGNFVIVIHNPRSKKRRKQLVQARDIILQYRNPATPAGIVIGAFREEQQVVITDLEHLLENEIDMNTTVIVGNSQTFSFDDFMVTPRGYQQKYNLGGGE